MSDIAINPVTRRVQFTGNTGTGPYAFTFNVLQSSDIVVYKNNVLLTETTDYTVSIAANGTGNITMVVALVLTDILTIIGGRELSRTTDFVTAGDLLASSLNEQLDSNVIMSQQLDERFGRTLNVPPGDEDKTLALPLAADRADKVLTFDTEGNVQAQTASDLFGGAVLGGNFVVNTGTGDGSTVAFGLTGSPGVKTNIQIYIDGVYQDKASFSLSGQTVTFTEAPPLNAGIEFISGESVTTITGDASAITYNQGGTGAQDRTVEAKLQEFLSVKDFGAVGDGSADDTAAIEAAFAAARAGRGTKRGTIYFPFGTYKITSQITVQNPNIYMERDTEIKADSSFSGTAMFEITAGNKSQNWIGGRINGNSVSGIIGILAKDFAYSFERILIQNCDTGMKTTTFGVRILDARFADNTTYGLHCIDDNAPWNNGLIDRTIFTDNGVNVFTESSGSVITLQNSAFQFANGAYNVRMETNADTTIQAATTIQNCYFEENINNIHSISFLSAGGVSFNALEITGNSIVGSGSGTGEIGIFIDAQQIRPIIAANRISNYDKAIKSTTTNGGVCMGNAITTSDTADFEFANIDRWVMFNNRATSTTLKNYGTAQITGGNGSVTVTHGLTYTPDPLGIKLVKTGDSTSTGAGFWVENIGATTFDIARSGTTGISSFSWFADTNSKYS